MLCRFAVTIGYGIACNLCPLFLDCKPHILQAFVFCQILSAMFDTPPLPHCSVFLGVEEGDGNFLIPSLSISFSEQLLFVKVEFAILNQRKFLFLRKLNLRKLNNYMKKMKHNTDDRFSHDLFSLNISLLLYKRKFIKYP